MINISEIPNLSDNELLNVLKEANLNNGPVTATTRSIYEKSLLVI